MEAIRIEMYTLLPAGFKKTEISRQLNFRRMTVCRVEQRLKVFSKGSSLIEKPQVIS